MSDMEDISDVEIAGVMMNPSKIAIWTGEAWTALEGGLNKGRGAYLMKPLKKKRWRSKKMHNRHIKDCDKSD